MKKSFLLWLVFIPAFVGCSINASNKQSETKLSAADVYAKYAKKLLSEGNYKMAREMAARAKNTPLAWDIELMDIKTRAILAEQRPDILKKGDAEILKTDLIIIESEKPGMGLDAKVIQGHLALVLRKFDKASKLYKEVLKKAPDNPGAHFGLGWVYRLQGKPDDAFKEFTAGLKTAPDNYGALVSLAEMSMMNKKFADAGKYYSHALNVEPTSIDTAKGLVQALYLQKKNDKALALLDNLIEQAPKDPDVFIWRGELLAAKKKWNEVIKMASIAVRLRAGVNAWVLLARGYLELKQFGQAQNVLKEALKNAKGNLQLNFLMAVTLERMGRNAEALKAYQSILNVIKGANPKIAAKLKDVQASCESAIARLSKGIANPQKHK